MNETCEFRELSMNEIEQVIGEGLRTAIAGACFGAPIGGLAGYKAGVALTPVCPIAIPLCTSIGTVGGAGVGFVEGW